MSGLSSSTAGYTSLERQLIKELYELSQAVELLTGVVAYLIQEPEDASTLSTADPYATGWS